MNTQKINISSVIMELWYLLNEHQVMNYWLKYISIHFLLKTYIHFFQECISL